MNLKNINKNWLLLGGAVVLGGGAVVLSNQAIKSRIQEIEAEAARGSEMVSIVVPIRDLEKGEPLSADVVAARKVPKQYVHAGALTPERFGQVINERLAAPLKRGEAVLDVHIDGMGNRVFSTLVKKGMRAITTEVDDNNSISGMLRPGDKIDLIFRVKDNTDPKAPEVVFPLLSDVTVLATGQSVTKKNEEGAEHTFTSMTLEVPPADADRILLAKASGSLNAVLRHPDDKEQNNTPRFSLDNLMTKNVGKTQARTVEYVIGGGGDPGEVQLVTLERPKPGATQISRSAVADVSTKNAPDAQAKAVAAAVKAVVAQAATQSRAGQVGTTNANAVAGTQGK